MDRKESKGRQKNPSANLMKSSTFQKFHTLYNLNAGGNQKEK